MTRLAVGRTTPALICAALVIAACGSATDGDPAASTTATPAVSTSTTPAPTAPTAPTTTATTIPVDDALRSTSPILVSNQEGVFQIDTDGTITQLVYGPVAYAIDDTRGGLLFQVDRGRDWEDFMGEPTPGFDTTVWWVPGGESAAQQLLVPTPDAGHTLTLYDALAVDDSFAVAYLRHEGEAPPFEGEMADTLRIYDRSSGEVTELARVRGWEWNLDDVSAGGGLVAATEHMIIGGGCRVWDTDGKPADAPGVPTATPACFSETGDCPVSCVLSANAASVAYSWIRPLEGDGFDWEVVTGPVDGNVEPVGFVIPVVGRWGPGDLDVSAGAVLLNRQWEGLYGLPALLADTSHPDAAPDELPVAGRARFAGAPVELGGPVPSPDLHAGPDFYRYGDDGLYRIVGGTELQLDDRPVLSAHDDLLGGVLYRYHWEIESHGTFWLVAGTTEPIAIDPSDDFYWTGQLKGRPHLFYPDLDPSPPSDETCLTARDLVDDSETSLLCGMGVAGQDGGVAVRSAGGGRLAGVVWMAIGGEGTHSRVSMWATEGTVLDLPGNPMPSPCEPCTLSVHLSDDGSRLAYSYWPAAFWNIETESIETARDEWWRSVSTIAVELGVTDLDTGVTLWTSSTSPWASVTDFDGRWLVVQSEGWSTIHDTVGDTESIVVEGGVALRRPPASGTTYATDLTERAVPAQEVRMWDPG